MSEPDVFVGIDVSKVQLDVALRPTDDHWPVSNDELGIATLVERLRTIQPVLIVLEVPVAGALAAAGLPVVVVNPRHARDFAKATGRLAKTDPLDAQGLAHVAEAVWPTPRPLPDAQAQTLSALLTRRRQLVQIAHGRASPPAECPAAHPRGHPGAHRRARAPLGAHR